MAESAALAYLSSRQRLRDRIVAEIRETAGLTGCDELSANVLDALATVPRHLFIPPEQLDLAYADMPLSIGYSQTISQPFIVALMTQLLAPDPEAVVLEIGTGSGYQTAVLATLVRQVYSIERIPALAESAARRLGELGFANIALRCADGADGWKEQAPFDGMMVTAAAQEVPSALIQQLKPNGRLIIPVGQQHRSQALCVITKSEDGTIECRNALPVVFVPLVSDPA